VSFVAYPIKCSFKFLILTLHSSLYVEVLFIYYCFYFQVNCISTEFTPKKHGGEKGVPFRIQVETYSNDEANLRRLHAAVCQIKVFKVSWKIILITK
jgi:hypothetical protein